MRASGRFDARQDVQVNGEDLHRLPPPGPEAFCVDRREIRVPYVMPRRAPRHDDRSQALAELVGGDMSRLGRNLGQVIQLVDELVKRKVRFEGKQDLQTK